MAKKKANPKSQIPNPQSPIPAAPIGLPAEIPIKQISVGRFNPRESFPPEEIRELAGTIRTHGLLQPIVVRTIGKTGKYGLVAGERRLRACKLLDHDSIPATVIGVDDERAREMAGVENLQHKGLNPIEEARLFRQLTGNGRTETEVANRLGITQGQVSNRIRLLKLPETLRARIISGEIPASLARGIVPFVQYPNIIRAIEKNLGKPKPGQPIERDDFDFQVDDAIRRNTRAIKGKQYHSKSGKHVDNFKPTAEQREQLGIVVTDVWGTDKDGNGEDVAANTKLWDKLQAAHTEQWLAKQAALEEGKKGKGKGKDGKAAGKSKKKPAAQRSAYLQKKIEAEERERQKRQAAQFKKRLDEWKINWLRYLIAEEIGLGMERVGHADACRLLLCAAAAWKIDTWYSRMAPLEQVLERRVKIPRGRHNRLWAGVAALKDDSDVEELTIEFLQMCFWLGDDKGQGPSTLVPGADVEAVAGHLKIDLAARWKEEQAGPLSEAYWNLHSKDQLLELGAKLGAPVKGSKAAMVKTLLESQEVALPQELGKKKK